MKNKPPEIRQQVPRVTGFDLQERYRIEITFEDGVTRVIDFEPVLHGPLFGALREESLFRQVELDDTFGTLVWPNGADIAPEVLRDWPEHVDAIRARYKAQFGQEQS